MSIDTSPDRLAALESAARLVLEFVADVRAAGQDVPAPPPTSDQLDEMLGRRHVNELRVIQTVVARYYDLDVGRILSTDKRADCVQSRHVAMYLCRRLTACTYSELARSFCRDHSTVLYAVDRVERDSARQAEADRVGAVVRAVLQQRGMDSVETILEEMQA